MTIAPVTGVVVQQSIDEPTRAAATSSTDGAHAFPDGALETPPAPSSHASSVSSPEQTPPMPAAIAEGDTPGDEILAGLNKRWGRFSKTLNDAASKAASGELRGVDPAERAGSVWSPVEDTDDGTSRGRSGRVWLPANDGAYDSYLGDMARDGNGPMADATEGLGFQRTLDQGGLLTLELSEGAQAFESSIKKLVTGQ